MTPIKELIHGIPGCACGRDHQCPTQWVEIGSGVLETLPGYCKEYEKILLVADQNTYKACGREVEALLQDKVEKTLVYDSGDKPLIPNEEALETLEAAVSDATQIIIGVGSGVINDLCKQISFQKDLPYAIVATAPSMDGYTSVGSALILKGMKVTLNARPPMGVIADTRVLKSAPLDMIQAGVGDVVGKYSCLNDWKLSALVNGEYFCQKVYDLVMEAARTVESLSEAAVRREEAALGALMEALVAVGFEMSYVGNSRPASGSEHHLSHFFEITGILENKPYFSHGIDVVYSAVVTAAIREKVIASKPQPFTFDRADWEANIRRIYSTSAAEVIKLQDKMGWYREDGFENVARKWDAICALLAEAPTEARMRNIVKGIGLDYGEFEALYGKEKLADAVLYAKDLKDRYTVLWLAYQYCGR